MSADQYILKSVGSYITGAGQVGPLNTRGLPDIGTETIPVQDCSDEWMASLSKDDKDTVVAVCRDILEKN